MGAGAGVTMLALSARLWRGAAARITAAALCALACGSVWALKLHAPPEWPGVLVLYDCGGLRLPSVRGEACTPEQSRFHVASANHRGDARMLDEALASGRFREVWLVSGGGHLPEGLAVGRVLRRHGMAVRVPAGYRCVSACTVAFLGGVIRTVDGDASYMVHAASFYRRNLPDREHRELVSDPGRFLKQLGEEHHAESRTFGAGGSAVDLFVYFQEMLLGRPDPQAVLRVLATRPQSPAYLSSEAFNRLVARIQAEGSAAAHEAALWLERTAVESLIDDLRPQATSLGHRAEAALRLLETMYTSRIHLTATLSPETMLRLGIVTREVTVSGQR